MHRSEPLPAVYIIDFGSAYAWFDQEANTHIPCEDFGGHHGTVLFANTTAHSNMSMCCRDDLESLAYTLAYLLRGGTLPWSGIMGSERQQWSKIGKQKRGISPSVLLQVSTPSGLNS